jgi:hypothetical protein
MRSCSGASAGSGRLPLRSVAWPGSAERPDEPGAERRGDRRARAGPGSSGGDPLPPPARGAPGALTGTGRGSPFSGRLRSRLERGEPGGERMRARELREDSAGRLLSPPGRGERAAGPRRLPAERRAAWSGERRHPLGRWRSQTARGRLAVSPSGWPPISVASPRLILRRRLLLHSMRFGGRAMARPGRFDLLVIGAGEALEAPDVAFRFLPLLSPELTTGLNGQ